ncbi:aldo/keto reductase [uncultured Sphaerochaeta sp.]|uniref:aldo/keto reductase n=1 Tax=uncultured Sphaerochaeta sp. TaxID=886478 RepID=UPI002A0A8019|nr:aldo/keto reductase [uncultured Sphaerochaeta sp.]
MIPRMEFGRTGHLSTRIIFGAASLGEVTSEETENTFELLAKYGINHIDTAQSYGKSERRIGPWMKHHRKDYFLATKTDQRTKDKALVDLYESLDKLQTDHIDLWQFHCLVDQKEWDTAMGEGGVLEAALEAKKQGLVKYIGVTGHGMNAPLMHLKSLEQFPFDSVLFPYNYTMMQQPAYKEQATKLLALCEERGVAVQTIKSVAKRNVEDRDNSYATWYEPLDEERAIEQSVQWVLGNRQVFLNSVGDIHLLPHVLEAASAQINPVSDATMDAMIETYGMKPLFT